MTTTVAELSVRVSGDLAPLLSSLKKAQVELTSFDKASQSSAKKINASIGNIKPQINTNNARMQLSTLEFYAQKTANKVRSALDIKSNIRVSPIKGGGSRPFKESENSVNNLQSTVSRLALTIGTYLSVRELQQYADTWTEAGNKIRAAAEIAGVQARSLSEVNKIATETRSSIEETADLYSKLIRTASGVAKSETEIATAVEVVNKAFKAGGSSLREQQNGIIQLGQALGSGILQGDELRSIRENAPVLAQAIAKEFGTTVAGLKALGAEGKLTSDRILKAIINAQDQVGKAFKKTTPTIEEQFSLLRNGLIEYIGTTAKAIGATQAISNIMGALTKNVGSVVNAAAAAAAVLLGLIAVPAIIGAISNPFVLLAVAVAGVTFAISEMWDEIVPLEGTFATLGDFALGFFDILHQGANDVANTIVPIFYNLTNAITASMLSSQVATQQNMAKQSSYLNDFVNAVLNDMLKLKDSLYTVFVNLPGAVMAAVVGTMNLVVQGIERHVNQILHAINSVVSAASYLSESLGGEGLKGFDDISLGNIPNPWEKNADNLTSDLKDIWTRQGQDWVGAVQNALDESDKIIIDGLKGAANARHRSRIEGIKDADQSATAAGEYGGSTRGFGGGSPAVGSSGSKKKGAKPFDQEVQQIKERTAVLIAQTEAQSKLNPLVDDYGYAVEYAKAKQELLNAAEKQHLNVTAEIAANIEKLAAAYASAHAESEKLTKQQDKLKEEYEGFRSTSRDVLQGFVKDLIDGKSAAEALANALNKIADKLLDKAFDLIFDSKEDGGSGLFDSIFKVLFKANGGYISGPGTGTSDSIPARLSDGEYVVNAKQTAKYRPMLEAINAGKVPKFASGGYVSVPNARMGTGSISSGGARQQLEIKLQTDDSMVAAVADARIRNATPNIVGASVKVSQQQTKQNFGQYVSNYNARQG